MLDCVIKAILLSMVVASISFFISHSQLLEKFRNWLGELGGADKPWRSFVGEVAIFFYNLITCCYCLGHWIAFILLLFFPVKLFIELTPLMFMEPICGRGELIVDFILTWLVISWMAGIQSLAASQLWGE